MIQTTRWTPDTCPRPACVVEYTWDDAVPDAARVHTFANVIRRCVAHVSLPTDPDVYASVTEENPRKNFTLARLFELDPTLFDPVSRHPDPAKLLWAFDPVRVLEITLPLVSGVTKGMYQADLDGRFGAGKVRVS